MWRDLNVWERNGKNFLKPGKWNFRIDKHSFGAIRENMQLKSLLFRINSYDYIDSAILNSLAHHSPH